MIDYKKFLKSRDLRLKILNGLSWVPNKTMIKLQYRIKTGRKLNLENPKRYTEKLQYYKLNYRDDLMPKCVDKYDVRNYVKEKGYSGLLNQLYIMYDSEKRIDFSSLPDKFVIKDTIGAGSNSVLVVNKKSSKYNEDEVKGVMKSWLAIKPSKSVSREWPYDYLKHRVIVEKFLEQKNGDLDDYKFFCFNGRCEYFYKRSEYAKDHNGGKMSFYARDGKWLKGVGLDYCKASSEKQALCKNIGQMIEIADNLSKDFPHVRVDLYNIDGKIVFGELTFFNAGGYMIFTPDKFDYEMGEKFKVGGKNGF